MDFTDLKDDKEIQVKLTTFRNSINKIDDLLNLILTHDVRESLDVKDSVDYDLFVSYALNTLYWMYLRTKGIDPNNNEVKGELVRIRTYMLKAKEAHERNTIRPKINQEVAKRFIKHGIHNSEEPTAKRKKFD